MMYCSCKFIANDCCNICACESVYGQLIVDSLINKTIYSHKIAAFRIYGTIFQKNPMGKLLYFTMILHLPAFRLNTRLLI